MKTMTHMPPPSKPTETIGEMLEEVIDLCTGLGVALLPLLVLAVPSIVLFVLLPAILLLALAAPFAVIGVVIAGPPYLLVRWRRRRRDVRAGAQRARAGVRAGSLGRA